MRSAEGHLRSAEHCSARITRMSGAMLRAPIKLRNEPNLSCLSIFIHIRTERSWDVPAVFTKRTHPHPCPHPMGEGAERRCENYETNPTSMDRRFSGCQISDGSGPAVTDRRYSETNPFQFPCPV